MKVTLLCEAGRGIGLGHLTRCLALYEALKERKISAELLVNGDKNIEEKLAEFRFKRFDWTKKRDLLYKLIKDSSIVVIDSYFADRKLYEEIAKRAHVSVYIDDCKRLPYPQGVILNGNIYALRLRYPKRPGLTYLLGTKYTPMRREYWKIPQKRISKRVKNIVLMLGGDDIRRLAPGFMKMLRNRYPDFNKIVIFNSAFGNRKAIVKAGSHPNMRLLYNLDTAGIKKIMLEADIAVSAGGQTAYELLRMGVPVIGLAIYNNQLQNVQNLYRKGLIRYIGRHCGKNILSRLDLEIKKLLPHKVRSYYSNKARKVVDGNGSRRVVSFLLESIKPGLRLRKAAKGDELDLFRWRNAPAVRRWSATKNKVSLAEHKKWFRQSLKDRRTKIFIAMLGQHKSGVIRFNRENNRFIVSVNLNPRFLHRGLGAELIRMGTQKVEMKGMTIRALIYHDNHASQRAFMKAGYCLKKTIKDKGLLIYER